MTATVTLGWEDPEDASEFLRLREQARREGWLPDTSRDALWELVESSEVVKDSSKEEQDG